MPYDDPTLLEAWNNIVRGLTSKKQLEEAGRGIKSMVSHVPNVAESVARGALAQIPGTFGDISQAVRDYVPGGLQTMQQIAGPRTMPTTEEILAKIPRATSGYENAASHEIVGGLIGPAVGKLAKMSAEATKNVPVGNMIAYHGTPHDFDAFDIAKVGTGEGAQAYGHGMYFAESPGVAQSYKRKLSDSVLMLNDKPLEMQYDTLRQQYGEAPGAILEYASDNGLSNAKSLIRNYLNNPKNARYFGDPAIDNASQEEIFKALQALDNVKKKSLGNLLTVDIPDEHIPKMLDWDKPLSKQKHVWEAIPENVKNNIDDILENQFYKNSMSNALEGYTGKHLYKILQHPEIHDTLPPELPGSSWYTGDTTHQKHTSAFLDSLGIKGIKYLDNTSRRSVPDIRAISMPSGETAFEVNPGWIAPNNKKVFSTIKEAEAYADSLGNKNYVIFNPEEVKILQKRKD